MKFAMKNSNKGFSLVELMIVVGIIGVLASMALPRLQVFMAKAKQSEAKTGLANLNTLQEAYFNDNNSVYPTTLALAGFSAPGGDGTLGQAVGARYTFALGALNVNTATSTALLCTGAAANDKWTMTQNRVLTNTVNGANKCD